MSDELEEIGDAKIFLENTTVERKYTKDNMPVKLIKGLVKQSWDSLCHRAITQLGACEGRIFMRIVETAQGEITNILDRRILIEETVLGDRELTIPLNSFLADDDDKNYRQVKDALIALSSTMLIQDSDKEFKGIHLIERPKYDKYSRKISFRVPSPVWSSLLNLSSGYVEYNLHIAMSFRSKYARFFYQILSKNDNITYSLDRLREILGVQDKYLQLNDFRRRILLSAQNELKKRADYSFQYEEVTKEKNKVIFTFRKVYNDNYERPEVKSQYLLIDKNVILYLRAIGFSESERENNKLLFAKLQEKMGSADLCGLIGEIKTRALQMGMRQYKGYIISELKKELPDSKNEALADFKKSAEKVREVEDIVSKFASKLGKV